MKLELEQDWETIINVAFKRILLLFFWNSPFRKRRSNIVTLVVTHLEYTTF